MHGSPILSTMVAAIVAGVFLIVVARRAGLPALILLLAGGVILGQSGVGLVQPELLGDGLSVLVSLLVGVILFEGGLTLDLEGYRRTPQIIVRLLTVGVLTTWLGIAFAVWWIGGRSASFAMVSASLLIVTGPTVIGPLLQRLRVKARVHHVLQWEGVLIDPIGVFIAILCVELFAMDKGGSALLGFALRAGSGMAIGLVGGVVLVHALRRDWIPEDMAGVASLAWAILLFGLSEIVAHEAGLLSVTVAGFYVGLRRPQGLRSVLHFKREVTELSIGLLFILLSARLDLTQFVDFGWRGVAIVVAVMLLVRPLSIALSTAGLGTPWRERAFLSWVAPRGIVAASMASLLALELERMGVPDARFVESLTYAVIVGTIVVQGTTAGPLARVLKLVRGPEDEPAHVRFDRDPARHLADEDTVTLELTASNRTTVTHRALMGMHERYPTLSLDQLHEQVAAQEVEFPSSVGDGVALPHARVESLDRPRFAVVKLSHPVDWAAPDGVPVDIVIMLLSPAADHDGHLRLLASLARRLAEPERRDELRERPVTSWPAILARPPATVDAAA